MTDTPSTCRFCGRLIWTHEEGVKYGVRHYAHHRCYLQSGKPLADLHDWQIVRFPYGVIVEFGLQDEATDAQLRLNAARQQARQDDERKGTT